MWEHSWGVSGCSKVKIPWGRNEIDMLLRSANFIYRFRKIWLATGRDAGSIGSDPFLAFILMMIGDAAVGADLFVVRVGSPWTLLLLEVSARLLLLLLTLVVLRSRLTFVPVVLSWLLLEWLLRTVRTELRLDSIHVQFLFFRPVPVLQQQKSPFCFLYLWSVLVRLQDPLLWTSMWDSVDEWPFSGRMVVQL